MDRRAFVFVFVFALAPLSCNRTPPEPVGSPNPPPAQDSSARGSRLGPPRVEVPSGTPPTTLQQRDLVVGTGPLAETGREVDVQYTGVAWSTRREFDSSWTRGGQPFTFRLGRGMVIPGWDQGVAGMRVGGRRELVIPPHLAYGERGSPPAIGPNETLVFVVDLVAVR